MKRLIGVMTASLCLLFSAAALSSCGGGGGGGGGNAAAGVCMNVAGAWTTNEQVNATTCPSGVYSENRSYTVTQTGCGLTVQDASGNTFSGSINGSQITWSGSYPDSGGTTAITSMTLDVANNGTSFNGSCEWTWSGSGSSCSGSTGVTGVLASGGGGGDTAAPTTPAGLSVTAVSSGQINLSWSASTDNVGVTAYNVYRGSVFLKQVTSTASSDTGLSPGTQYCYAVTAVDAAGNESQHSAQLCTTTQSGGSGGDTSAPSTPTGLLAIPLSSSQISLSWNAATDNTGVAGYRVYSGTGTLLTVTAATSASMTGLSASTQYCYQVSAYDAANNESPLSTQACAITQSGGGGGDLTPPTAPAGLTGTVVGSSQINLTWTASTDNVGVVEYRLERCQGASCSSFSQIATPLTAGYSDTSLAASTSYSYRVRAADAAGNVSGYSNTFSATTQTGGGDTAPPSAPTGLSATAVSSSQINLSWTASTDNVGVAGYKVYEDDNVPITPLLFRKNVTGTSTPMTGLIASAQYCYRVSAFDAANNESGVSAQACATTQSAGPTTVTFYAARDAAIVWSDASAGFANTNYGSNTTMELGIDFEYGYEFSTYMKEGVLVDFVFDPGTWSGKTITSAKLKLYVYDYAVHGTGRYVAYKIVDTLIGGNYQYPWAETGVTWNNAPPYALSPTSTAYAPSNPAQYTEWDVTSIVQEWFTSGTMGNGIIIHDMAAPLGLFFTTNQVTNYYARENPTQAYRPQLTITY